MNWKKLLNPSRLGQSSQKLCKTDTRSPFQVDVDRVIFSGAFRRLSRKTQVHPFCKSDHVHTRLTHSLEVGQVGRSLGRTLALRLGDKLPKEISVEDFGSVVQAACLAHDIGNPPFGHAGEEAISHWFASEGITFLKGFKGPHQRDIGRFEGNAQGFRILTQTENHLFHGGLRLTYATLATFSKYPWSSKAVVDSQKFGAFISEEEILAKVASAVGLKKKGKKWARHPLAYLTEAADDICYATIDLEDAVELGVLPPRKAYDLLLSALDKKTRDSTSKSLLDDKAYRVNFARLRGDVFEALITSTIDAFEQNYDTIMNGSFNGDLIASLPEANPCRKLIEDAKDIGKTDIYTGRYKTEVELGCFATFECILEAFCAAAVESFHHIQSPSDETAKSWRSVLVLRQLGNHAPSADNSPNEEWSKYLCLRRVLDYVSGMTDTYARDLAEQMRGICGHW